MKPHCTKGCGWLRIIKEACERMNKFEEVRHDQQAQGGQWKMDRAGGARYETPCEADCGDLPDAKPSHGVSSSE